MTPANEMSPDMETLRRDVHDTIKQTYRTRTLLVHVVAKMQRGDLGERRSVSESELDGAQGLSGLCAVGVAKRTERHRHGFESG